MGLPIIRAEVGTTRLRREHSRRASQSKHGPALQLAQTDNSPPNSSDGSYGGTDPPEPEEPAPNKEACVLAAIGDATNRI